MKQALTIAMVMWFGLAMARGDAPDSKSKPALKAFRSIRIDLSPSYPGVPNVQYTDGPGYEVKIIKGDNFIVYNVSFNFEGLNPALVISNDANNVADEYVERMKSEMKAVVSSQQDAYRSQLEGWERQLKHEQEREGNASDQLAQLRAAVASDTGLADASSESARALTQNMEIIRETAELDIAGKTARQKALADAIAKLSDQVESKLNSDLIAEQLQKVADARQKALDAIEPLQKAGAATDENVNAAMAALAEAKAALLERKEAAAKTAGADILEQWNTDL